MPSLISVHNFLGQPEAANGVLRHASKALNMQIKDEWYEKLQRWGEAYAAYARRAQESRELGAEGDAARLEASEGQMRCLRAVFLLYADAGPRLGAAALPPAQWHRFCIDLLRTPS